MVCYSLSLFLPSQVLCALLTPLARNCLLYRHKPYIEAQTSQKGWAWLLRNCRLLEDDGSDGFACKATTPCHLRSSHLSRCAGPILFQTLRWQKARQSAHSHMRACLLCRGHESSLPLEISWVSPPASPTKTDLTSDKLMNVLR